jgi:hypothetical protein
MRAWRRRLASGAEQAGGGAGQGAGAAQVGAGQVGGAAQGGPGADGQAKESWRMPPLAMLAPVRMSTGRRVAMLSMWAYLGLAFVLVIVRVIELAVGH